MRLGDNKKIQVEGKGTIAIKTSHGNVKLLYDVMLVPSLTHNLLSIRQLMTSEYSILFDDAHALLKIRNLATPLLIFKWPITKCFHLILHWLTNVLWPLAAVVRLYYGIYDMSI